MLATLEVICWVTKLLAFLFVCLFFFYFFYFLNPCGIGWYLLWSIYFKCSVIIIFLFYIKNHYLKCFRHDTWKHIIMIYDIIIWVLKFLFFHFTKKKKKKKILFSLVSQFITHHPWTSLALHYPKVQTYTGLGLSLKRKNPGPSIKVHSPSNGLSFTTTTRFSKILYPNQRIIFFRKFQLITSALNSSLSSDQDTNRFLVLAGFEIKISYSTIRDLINWFNWNSPKE